MYMNFEIALADYDVTALNVIIYWPKEQFGVILHQAALYPITETFPCRLGNFFKLILYNYFNILFLFAEKKINIKFLEVNVRQTCFW